MIIKRNYIIHYKCRIAISICNTITKYFYLEIRHIVLCSEPEFKLQTKEQLYY